MRLTLYSVLLAFAAAAALLLAGCAGYPCPSELNLYGGREWGRTSGYGGTSSADKSGKAESSQGGGAYRGYQAGAGLTFDLGTPNGGCVAYGGLSYLDEEVH